MDNLFALAWDIITVKYRKKTALRTVQPAATQRDFERDCLADVVVTEQSARASTRLLLTSWSSMFVHSSEVMLPMLQLAETYSGEKIARIEDTKFISPVQSELELEATILRPEEPITRKSSAQVIMRCTTQKDKTIEIVGKPLRKPIEGGTWTGHQDVLTNSLEGTVYQDIKLLCPTNDVHRMEILPVLRAPLASDHQLHTLPGPTATVISFDIGLNIVGHMLPKSGQSLVLGCQKFTMPTTEWTGMGQITCSPLQTRRASRDIQKTLFSINILDPNNRPIGGGMVSIGTLMSARASLKFAAGLYRGKWTK